LLHFINFINFYNLLFRTSILKLEEIINLILKHTHTHTHTYTHTHTHTHTK